MTVQTTVLKDVAMVMLNISVWSGAKKLEPSDFINIDVDDLPSSRVASYGIKHLIEKDLIQPFKTIRGQAERICSRYGTRLLGGFAIPQDCVDLIGNELTQLCANFETQIDDFMAQYDKATEDWISSNPDFAEPLRRAMLPRAHVRSRFKASFSIFEVSASPRDQTNSLSSVGNDLLDSVLGSVVTAIKPQLERKAGSAAPDWFRVEVRQTIAEVGQKLRRFAFVDPSGGMKVLANDLESSVAGTGKIHGAEFTHLWGIISRFTSVDALKAIVAEKSVGAQDIRPLDTAPMPIEANPATIKDDFGFPLGGFPMETDTPEVRDDSPMAPNVDDFPAFNLDLEPAGHTAIEPQSAKPVDAPKPFSLSIDF